MNTMMSESYEPTLTHMKNIKQAYFTGKSFSDCCASIVSNEDRLDSAGVLNPEYLEDLSSILEESKDNCFQVWEMVKYHKVTNFLLQLRAKNSKSIPAINRITYETMTQKACSEYHNLVGSSNWERAGGTK